MPSLRAYVLVGTLILACAASGCYTKPGPELKPESLVGDYVFQMADSGAPHHDPDRLTLRPDGRYLLVRMPAGNPGSTEEGTWELRTNFQPRVAFGNRTYPIEIKGKHVRLIVNDDLGYWYEKTLPGVQR